MAINMTRAGAEGGFLEDALERVAKFTEDAEDLKARTVGAMAYPAFLGCRGQRCRGGADHLSLCPVLRRCSTAFATRANLPLATELLLGFISNFLRSFGGSS